MRTGGSEGNVRLDPLCLIPNTVSYGLSWEMVGMRTTPAVYLGAYDDEEAAARAYDLAALKYWGPGTLINFPVTDYSRDLEEMQLVSREAYLASLRRKSSGFSRGLSKFRGLPRPPQSSRWETSFGQMLGSEYFGSLNCGPSEDVATENEFAGGFCLERKIDITSYIRWWGHRKASRADLHAKSSEGTRNIPEDVGSELKTVEWSIQHTEPYQLPSLGLPHKRKHLSSMSACSILSQSSAFKQLQEKISESSEGNGDQKLIGGGTDASGVPLRLSDMPLQRAPYPLAPLLSAPLLSTYNSIDQPLPDPIFWTSLIQPTGLPVSATLSEAGPTSSTAVWRRAV